MGWMVLSVGLGGALGAISRYLISLWVTSSFGQSGWMAILSVNVAGSLIMGYDGSSADSLLSVQRSGSRVCNDRVSWCSDYIFQLCS